MICKSLNSMKTLYISYFRDKLIQLKSFQIRAICGRSDFDFHSLSKPPPEVSPKRLRRKRLAVWKLVRKFKSCADYNKKNRVSKDTLFFLVGVTRLELATPRPPVWCATTCATPRTQCFNTITQHLQ